MTWSQDGRWWWDGRAWLPVVPVATVLRPTAWTVPLQRAAAALLVIATVWAAIALPASMAAAMAAPAAFVQTFTPATMPAADQEQLNRFMQSYLQATTIVTAVVTGVLTVAWNIVLLVGCLKRWRWVFWYLMIVGLVGVLSWLSTTLLYLGATLVPGPLGSFVPPWRTLLGGFVLGAMQLTLAVWMLVALRRFGTWACVRTQEAPQPVA